MSNNSRELLNLKSFRTEFSVITSLLSKDGQLFYIKGSLFKTSKMSLQEKINNLKDAYNLKLQNFADALGMSPQQFSYKITHKLSLEDIKKSF